MCEIAFARVEVVDSLCAFLDILGFRQITSAANTNIQANDLLERLTRALEESTAAILETQMRENEWRHKFFTDNLVLGFPCPLDGSTASNVGLAEFINVAGTYQLAMSLNGFAVRGGLTGGPLYMSDDVVFGASLLRAYDIESNEAEFPRIKLDEALVDQVSSNIDFGDSVLRDIDGVLFVNYLAWTNFLDDYPVALGRNVLERHRDFVSQRLIDFPAGSVNEKYSWIASYHNYFCLNTADTLETGNLRQGESLLIPDIEPRAIEFAQDEINRP
jgi:hypothetical protein